MALVEEYRDGPVLNLVLNRPDARNALSGEMCDALVGILDAAAADRAVRAMVVRGEGSAFCSGADLAAVSGSGAAAFLPSFERMLETLARHRLPVVAAIHGAALGGGFQLAGVCDFRISSETAKIGIPSARLGILVNLENVRRLVLLAGAAVAKEILMTGRIYSGVQAEARGLVHSAVPDESLDAEVQRFTAELAALAPFSVRGSKRAIQAVLDTVGDVREAAPAAAEEIDELVRQAYASSDLIEGLEAASTKREPRFRGE